MTILPPKVIVYHLSVLGMRCLEPVPDVSGTRRGFSLHNHNQFFAGRHWQIPVHLHMHFFVQCTYFIPWSLQCERSHTHTQKTPKQWDLLRQNILEPCSIPLQRQNSGSKVYSARVWHAPHIFTVQWNHQHKPDWEQMEQKQNSVTIDDSENTFKNHWCIGAKMKEQFQVRWE